MVTVFGNGYIFFDQIIVDHIKIALIFSFFQKNI